MPDPPILPPNKKVEQLVTEITLTIHEMFKDEPVRVKQQDEMITYLVKELAIAKAIIDVYESSE